MSIKAPCPSGAHVNGSPVTAYDLGDVSIPHQMAEVSDTRVADAKQATASASGGACASTVVKCTLPRMRACFGSLGGRRQVCALRSPARFLISPDWECSQMWIASRARALAHVGAVRTRGPQWG
jgi:hypothetical protein